MTKLHTVREYSLFESDYDERKIRFEKDILKLLKKYKISKKTTAIQAIEIKCAVGKYPTIKIEKMLI